MKILIACEKSGKVRDAFIKRGHDAISCDVLPSDTPGPHYQGYLEDFIGSGEEWDMIIAFPPCTYLCSSGLHWNNRISGRSEKTEQALAFVSMILNRKCKRIVLENPRGRISTRIRKPEQSIQPHGSLHAAFAELLRKNSGHGGITKPIVDRTNLVLLRQGQWKERKRILEYLKQWPNSGELKYDYQNTVHEQRNQNNETA